MAEGSLLQSFYIMFKSNAKNAEKDMKNLQKTSDDTAKAIKKTKKNPTNSANPSRMPLKLARAHLPPMPAFLQ